MSGFDQEKSCKYYIRGQMKKYCDGSVKLVTGERVRYEFTESPFKAPELSFTVAGTGFNDVSNIDQCFLGLARSSARAGEVKYAQETLLDTNGSYRQGMGRRILPLQNVLVAKNGELIEGTVIDTRPLNGRWHIEFRDSPDMARVESYKETDIHPLEYVLPLYDEAEFFALNPPRSGKRTEDDFAKESEYLLQQWREQNPIKWRSFEEHFESLVQGREVPRRLAANGATVFDHSVFDTLDNTSRLLRTQLLEKWKLPHNNLLFDLIKDGLQKLKFITPRVNLLLLCGAIAPEVWVYKRLGIPLGTVVIQDIDIHAISVAVQAHPDVEFAIVSSDKRQPGDVRHLTSLDIVRELEVRVGGIHSVAITNPCQNFSKAGKKDGFESRNGRILHDCLAALSRLRESSGMPLCHAENVPSTTEIDEEMNNFVEPLLGKYFYACGSMVSASKRNRKFATNRPPVECSDEPQDGQPPCLNGNRPHISAASIVTDPLRVMHPQVRKIPTLMAGGATFDDVYEYESIEKRGPPSKSRLTPEEAERAMGYNNTSEVGWTKYSAIEAVKERIRNHNYERDGCVISLKDCAMPIGDGDGCAKEVSDKDRLKFLGNSQVVTLLEALYWNDRRLFPQIEE